MANQQARAVEYRRLASVSTALAEASELAHVREKHERAADSWNALALIDEARAENLAAGAKALSSAEQHEDADDTAEARAPLSAG